MSIYRSRKVFFDDNVVTWTDASEELAWHVPPAPLDGASGYAALRKLNPANVILPHGRKWFDGLPLDLRPVSLLKEYPRIVNLIALEWDNRSAMGKVFDDLLVDHRGGRTGFPVAVRKELRALQFYYFHDRPRKE